MKPDPRMPRAKEIVFLNEHVDCHNLLLYPTRLLSRLYAGFAFMDGFVFSCVRMPFLAPTRIFKARLSGWLITSAYLLTVDEFAKFAASFNSDNISTK